MPKKLLAVYRKGACFGEPDLLHAQPHSSTVVCSGVGMLALVPRKQYLVALLPLSSSRRRLLVSCYTSVAVYRGPLYCCTDACACGVGLGQGYAWL